MRIYLENRNLIRILAHQHEYQLCVAGRGVFVSHDDAVFEDLTSPDTPGREHSGCRRAALTRLSQSVDRAPALLKNADLAADVTVRELLTETTHRRSLDLSDLSPAE